MIDDIPWIDEPVTITVRMMPRDEHDRFVRLVRRLREATKRHHQLLTQQPHLPHSESLADLRRVERDVDAAIVSATRPSRPGLFEGGAA